MSWACKVLLDFVPSHTSIEHPWFREHPEYYVWADEPPNNWVAAFGGPAWTLDEETGRYYLHSFYPEQPDLDWRVPEVREAMGDVLRFWTGPGCGRLPGRRASAADEGRGPSRRPAWRRRPSPCRSATSTGASSTSTPKPGRRSALRSRRCARRRGTPSWSARSTGPRATSGPTSSISTSRSRSSSSTRRSTRSAWRRWSPKVSAWGESRGRSRTTTSPASRPGSARRRAARAAEFLLSLPGTVFLYQGDEIGMVDGDEADPPFDRAGRDSCRHPMQWEPEPLGGFTTGEPWLGLTDPERRSVSRPAGRRGIVPRALPAIDRRPPLASGRIGRVLFACRYPGVASPPRGGRVGPRFQGWTH